MVDFPKKSVLFFDCDHTIRRPDPKKTDSLCINTLEHHQMYDDIVDPIITWLLTHDTNFIGLVSNQGGVESGHIPLAFAQALMETTKNELYHTIKPKMGLPPEHIITVCAPLGGWLRKPNIGMFAVVQNEVNKEGYVLDVSTSLMVGDLESDKEAAEAAGIPFRWAYDFFKRENPTEELSGLQKAYTQLPGDIHDNLLG